MEALAAIWIELKCMLRVPDELRAWELASRLEDLAWAFPKRSAHLRAASLILRNNTADPNMALMAIEMAAHLVERSGTSTPPQRLVEEIRIAARALAEATERGVDCDVQKRHLAFCVAEL